LDEAAGAADARGVPDEGSSVRIDLIGLVIGFVRNGDAVHAMFVSKEARIAGIADGELFRSQPANSHIHGLDSSMIAVSHKGVATIILDSIVPVQNRDLETEVGSCAAIPLEDNGVLLPAR
jgi:hypothetical protein